MISKAAVRLIAFLASKGIMKDAQKYKNQFELLISTIICCVFILIVAIIMGIFPHTWLFLAGLLPLRYTAGGYRAKHHWANILVAVLAYVAIAFPLRFIPDDIFIPHVGFWASFSSSLILETSLFAILNLFGTLLVALVFAFKVLPSPVTSSWMPKPKMSAIQSASIIIMTINMAICLIRVYSLDPVIDVYVSYYVAGMIIAGISLIAKREGARGRDAQTNLGDVRKRDRKFRGFNPIPKSR